MSYQLLHEKLNAATRFRFPYDIRGINPNGIYVIFEEGEKFGDLDRIVRVGSHTGPNNLRTRLHRHYRRLNHRKTIFRGHVGRCILQQMNRPDYIPLWRLDTKSREDRERNLPLLDLPFEAEIEKFVSAHIQQKTSFALITNLEEKDERLRLEAGLIATIASYPERKSSATWLGHLSDNVNVRVSKMWNDKHINDTILSSDELNRLLQNIHY